MRLIDADVLFDAIYHAWGTEMDAGPASEFMEMINSAPTITPRPNYPLTLEELREMDGEPVWVTQPNDTLRPFWGLVNVEDETVSGNLYCATFEDYDTEWLAYRRKPEEAPADG